MGKVKWIGGVAADKAQDRHLRRDRYAVVEGNDLAPRVILDPAAQDAVLTNYDVNATLLLCGWHINSAQDPEQ